MSNFKVFFTDCCNSVVFAFSMARDVSKYLREEKKNERLCLTLG
jgi:hypothetical protein